MIADPSKWVGRWIRRPGTVTGAVASLLLLAILLQLLKGRDTPTTPQTQQQYLPSAAALDWMALSFDSVVADLYWIRALQYFGTTRRSNRTEKNYDLLYPLLDIVTTLDPRFNIAYRFGAIFLTEPSPDGPCRPDQAVTLLQKGAQHMPERWEYLMDTGFVYYRSLHDYAEAARWFRRAAAIPGSPRWLPSLAANTLAIGGNRRVSRALWQQIHETANDEWLQNETLRRLMQLDALDDIDPSCDGIRSVLGGHRTLARGLVSPRGDRSPPRAAGRPAWSRVSPTPFDPDGQGVAGIPSFTVAERAAARGDPVIT